MTIHRLFALLCLSGAALAASAAEPTGTLKKIRDLNTFTLGSHVCVRSQRLERAY